MLNNLNTIHYSMLCKLYGRKLYGSWSEQSHHLSERQFSLFSAIACALDIGCSNWSLMYITVSL